MLRAVIDVNVLVSGLLRPASSSPPARVRHTLTSGAIRAIASPDLVSELDEVLHRRKLACYLFIGQAIPAAEPRSWSTASSASS